MCQLSIAIDQSVLTLAPLFELIGESTFHLRSVRVAPVAWSSKADVYLSLGGGSRDELEALLRAIARLPAVLSTHHTLPPVWNSRVLTE